MNKSRWRKLADKCPKCNDEALEYSKFCEKLWFMQAAYRRRGLGKGGWEILRQIWISQNKRCPYSGEELIPGKNMHLDHKNPVSRFPEQLADPKNFEWVLDSINRHKSSMTKEELLLKGAVCHILNRDQDLGIMYREVARSGELTEAAEGSMKGFYRASMVNVLEANILSHVNSLGEEMTASVADTFFSQLFWYLSVDKPAEIQDYKGLIECLIENQFQMFRQFAEWDADEDQFLGYYDDPNIKRQKLFWET